MTTAETTRLSGAVALESRKVLLEMAGAPLLDAALSSLPAADQEHFRSPTVAGADGVDEDPGWRGRRGTWRR